MGLTLVKVAVYRKMLEAGLPKDEYGYPEWYRTPGTDSDLMIDENGILQGGGTEDLYFCHAAEKLGFEAWVDTGKHAFAFHYELGSREHWPKPQWEMHRKNQPITWDTPDGLISWD